MVRSCAIKNCKITWAPNTKISFHNFPVKNADLLAEWLKAIPSELINTPTLYTYVCSKHFLPDCYLPQIYNSRNYLRKNAIPTVFNDSVMKSMEAELIKATAAVNTVSTIVKESSIFMDGNCICDKENNQTNTIIIDNNNKTPINSTPTSNQFQKRSASNTWTQTSSKYLKPSSREEELVKKVKVLQRRLRRREEKMESMEQLIKAMKLRLIRDQRKKFVIT